MSQRTNDAMANAWLTADVALSRKIRKNELEVKQDEYDALLQTIIDAQQESIDAEDDWSLIAGLTTAGLFIADQWANITSGGAWNAIKGITLATGAYTVGSEAGRIGYQGYAALTDVEGDIDLLVDDLATHDWILSEAANKYNRHEGDDALFELEGRVGDQLTAYEDWADKFYNPKDHLLNLGSNLLTMDTAGTKAFGQAYYDPGTTIV